MIEICGLRPLNYFQRGPRHLTSNRPIRHPDDLNGLILRVAGEYLPLLRRGKLWEPSLLPMAFSESIYLTSARCTIEAQENPFALIHSAGFAEVQQYINLTEHVISWIFPVIGEKQFQATFSRSPEDFSSGSQRYAGL